MRGHTLGTERDVEIEEQSTLRKRFTPEEDRTLKALVAKMGSKIWDEIALHMPNRTARQCRDRYSNYLFKEITHQPWTPEEDRLILEKYQEYGPHWVKIAKHLNGRSGNNIKNRWHKCLSKKSLGRPPETGGHGIGAPVPLLNPSISVPYGSNHLETTSMNVVNSNTVGLTVPNSTDFSYGNIPSMTTFGSTNQVSTMNLFNVMIPTTNTVSMNGVAPMSSVSSGASGSNYLNAGAKTGAEPNKELGWLEPEDMWNRVFGEDDGFNFWRTGDKSLQ